jgi:hypothetical protein
VKRAGVESGVMVLIGKENKMIKFDLEIDIYRPLCEVFSFVVKPENDFHWQYGTLTSTQISKGAMGVGARFQATGHFMGRRMESVYEITEFEVNKKYGFKSRTGSMQSCTLYTFDVFKNSTRVSAFVQIDPGNPWKPSDTVTARTVKKQYRENLALLKGILETSPTEKQLYDWWLVSGPGR